MTPEGEIKRDIKRYLDSIGAYHFWPVQTGYGKRTVDCLCCYKGQFYGFEVKKPGGKPTPKQTIILDDICKAQGKAYYVWSLDHVVKIMFYAHDPRS